MPRMRIIRIRRCIIIVRFGIVSVSPIYWILMYFLIYHGISHNATPIKAPARTVLLIITDIRLAGYTPL